MNVQSEEITSPRLRLLPFAKSTAHAILHRDLIGLRVAEGWPHDGTYRALTMALEHDRPLGWMITVQGTVIGDCGTKGEVDAAGMVEIGYGLVAPLRGRGYGTESVAALTEWLLSRREVVTVRACTEIDNVASRRVLEKASFTFRGLDADGNSVSERERER